MMSHLRPHASFTKLNDGKHIFSHNELSEKAEAFLWVDAYDAREKYAIPNAFKAYENYYRMTIE